MAAHNEAPSFIFVYDRREKETPEKKIDTATIKTFNDLKSAIQEAFGLKKSDKYVITSTNREEISDDASWGMIDNGETLYLLKSLDQELVAPAKERVNYLPHYDTIVKGGMYEYYASEGQNPLPYAFAELIDNSLAATRNNEGSREIEIRLHLEEGRVYVIDNGKGMTSRQLNNWAIYRLSKFIRKDKRSKVVSEDDQEDDEDNESVIDPDAPKSLNSDISYFGVGGKQAVFFIGNSTRMITKPRGSQDVHELTISKEEFEKKEKNHEEIYSGFIRNRKAGDTSHISDEDETLRRLVEEEPDREHFTIVVIQGISKDHQAFLKERMADWSRQLAHIYHYYLHGPAGNLSPGDAQANVSLEPFQNIQIQIKLFATKNQQEPKVVDLRTIETDMQTQYIRAAGASFEFKALIDGAKVEGVLRYHPFLYDRETYPWDDKSQPTFEDEHGYAHSEQPARGRRPIFECYWNGRLIPYSQIDSFDWCNPPKKVKNIPVECYNRLSGVLWTDDNFQVSTNKLTFIDLELKLRDKLAVFTRILGGQEKRTSIEKEFNSWLKECHEQLDKQILFSQYQGQLVRLDLPKQRQSPWTAYKHVEWDGKVFKSGQMVRILRTVPTLLGTINRILLYGDYTGDVFATGGDLEIIQEPRSLYNEVKIVPLSKLDRQATSFMIRKFIDDEEAKLPSDLEVNWPEGNQVVNNEKRRAGKIIGDLKIEILNKKGDKINRLPGKDNANKKLLVELKVIWHDSPSGDQILVSHISQHGKNWPYWFRKMENVSNLGRYTLQLQAVINESGEKMFAGKLLPGWKINFHVIEGEAEKFSVGMLEGPFRVGTPFSIPLDLQDMNGHPARPSTPLKPKIEASGLELSYHTTSMKGHSTSLMIKDVIAKGQVQSNAGKNFNLTITVPELNSFSQVLKIRLLPGPAASLSVSPEDEMTVMNGSAPIFKVQVLDIAGNPTVLEGRQSIVCKFHGANDLPTYYLEGITTGGGQLTGDPIQVKKIKAEVKLTAKIDVQGSKTVKAVERSLKLVPSGKANEIQLFCTDPESGQTRQLKNSQEIAVVAGEMLDGLTYRLLDEADQEIKITEKLVQKIKVNWTAKPSRTMLLDGKLPAVRATTSVLEYKYCQVSVMENAGMELSFVIKPQPGEPDFLKCALSGSNQLGIGQPFTSEIQVKIMDKYGNEIDNIKDSATICKDMKVTGDGLKPERCKIFFDKGTKSVIIKGIVFEGNSCSTIGKKELTVTWRGLKDYVRLEMVAGPPAKMKILNYDPDEDILLFNESAFPKPITVQLQDVGGNPAKVPDIKMQLAKDVKLKLIPSAQPAKTNKEGIADFGMYTVSCSRGTYEIQPKAFISTGFVLSGPKLRVVVQPDPNRPCSLNVEYDNKVTLVVGQQLPDYEVKVYGEDGATLSAAKASHISLKLWKSEGQDTSSLPSRTLSYSPDTSNKKNTNSGTFFFKNVVAPDESGSYNIMFVFYDGKHQLFSNVIHTKIEPYTPARLEALHDLGTATVSNGKNQATRCIVRNLKLELRDKYNNHVTRGMNGSLTVDVASEEGETELPVLAGINNKNKLLSFTLAGGSCQIPQVLIQENSPGKDGCQYQLVCTVNCDKIPDDEDIQLTIPFLFYNDAKKQSEMAALTKERDSLQTAIRTYKSLFETTEQLIEELKISVKEAKIEETKIREDLRRNKVTGPQLNTVEGIEKLIKTFTASKQQELDKKRRTCSLATIMANDPDVLGKIGHLALIKDDDVARVLSWHMSSDMDCVVTLTTKKAKEIYKQTNGRQQVLPLDSIFKKSLTEWNKPLPHAKYMPNWRPMGNPMFARNLIIFEKSAAMCKTVFSMLLGDTLWIDTLDQANDYRKELVKFTNCPTILTREGDRIRSNGKFGGLMNKAPPVDKLRGAIFGAPVPESYNQLCSTIELLHNLKSAAESHQTVKEDLDEQMATINTPEMQAKYEECRLVQKQLKELETKLGVASTNRGGFSTPVAPISIVKIVKRTPDRGNDESPQALSSKRVRASPAAPDMNGRVSPASSTSSVGSMSTPTRSSRRIASMSPAGGSAAKKPKRG